MSKPRLAHSLTLMHIRSLARRMALQILYQIDIMHDTVDIVLESFWKSRKVDPVVQSFAELLVKGALEHLPIIDQAIQEISEHWTLERMPTVDRCILRSATYELLYLLDISPAVVINEAVELAKTFSTEESPAFINAVLDKLKDRGPELVPIRDMRTSTGVEEEA